MKSRFSADILPTERLPAAPQAGAERNLAHVPAFRVGRAEVRPATREVVCGARREIVEPRMMQVLIALAEAGGKILSRDDLVALCWGGRAVTDDAINRVLSRLRAVGTKLQAYRIETIVKVGYRLVPTRGDRLLSQKLRSPETSETVRVDRRMVIGGAAAVAATGSAAVLMRSSTHHPPSGARDLFERGELAQREGMLDQTRQAISFFEEAVRVDPSYAEAWGALALSYDHLLEGAPDSEIAGLPARIRSAAERALQLEADNPDAQLALASIPPTYRNWARKESVLRVLARRFPRHWLIHGRLAGLLYQVGRFDDGIEFHRQALAIDPMLPIAYAAMGQAMLNAGRLQEAQAVLDRAHQLWPAHPVLWQTRFDFLIFSGRPDSAASFLMDPDSLPSGFGAPEVAPRMRLAHAVASHRPAAVEESIDDYRRLALADVTAIPYSAAVFSLFGRLDLSFECLERYYFNLGNFGAPVALTAYTRRTTDWLFAPAMAQARSDVRYESLLRRAGLRDYWASTRTLPDFRRRLIG
jgi:DNA-binding winged helix-turn-helix (wHTH) protein/tetratricopeptide (TPR) repeat protein